MYSIISRTALVTFFWIVPIVSAQFNFFDQMFGHHQQQQHRGPSASQWTTHAESVVCSEYLCPDTLLCVPNPIECPCPNVEDEKCIIPDAHEKGSGTVICVRGHDGCAEVERLASRWK